MRSALDGSHFVSIGKGWWRSYRVMRTSAATTGRKCQTLTLRYDLVSRHFTHKAALKAAHRRNIQEGRTA